MNVETSAFRFQLSPAELHWLAGAFGLTRLYLPDDPMRGLAPAQVQPRLNAGLTSLQARGLIRRLAPATWDVDRVPAGIIRWMGGAETIGLIDIHLRTGGSYATCVFTQGDAALAGSLRDKNYEFTIYPGRAPCFADLLGAAGAVFSDVAPDPQCWDVPQPGIVVRTTWKDAALAERMLRVAGLKPRQIKPLLAWMQTLQWLAVVNELDIHAERNLLRLRTVAGGDRHNVWNTNGALENDEMLSLVYTPRKQVTAMLHNLL
jgi:hypothetical protein